VRDTSNERLYVKATIPSPKKVSKEATKVGSKSIQEAVNAYPGNPGDGYK